ncbi:MAG: CPBP family intramembrane glutamic endopeptidase [Chloroflexota bacterium]
MAPPDFTEAQPARTARRTRQHIWSDDQAASISLAGFVSFVLLSMAWLLIAEQNARLRNGLPFDGSSGLVLFGAAIVSLIAFGGSIYVIGVRQHPLAWRAVGIRRTSFGWVAVSLALGVFFVPVSVTLSLIMQESLTGEPMQPNRPAPTFEQVPLAEFALVFVGIAVIVPLAEELFFRGMLFQWLRTRTNLPVAVGVSAVVFGAVHLSIPSLLSLAIVGVFCALVYEYSGSIWNATIIHAANNAVVVIVYYFVFNTPVVI